MPFAADAASYAASLVTLAAIRRPLVAAGAGERRHPGAEMVEGLRWLWQQPFLRSTTLLVAGSNGLFQAVTLAVIVVARGARRVAGRRRPHPGRVRRGRPGGCGGRGVVSARDSRRGPS